MSSVRESGVESEQGGGLPWSCGFSLGSCQPASPHHCSSISWGAAQLYFGGAGLGGPTGPLTDRAGVRRTPLRLALQEAPVWSGSKSSLRLAHSGDVCQAAKPTQCRSLGIPVLGRDAARY